MVTAIANHSVSSLTLKKCHKKKEANKKVITHSSRTMLDACMKKISVSSMKTSSSRAAVRRLCPVSISNMLSVRGLACSTSIGNNAGYSMMDTHSPFKHDTKYFGSFLDVEDVDCDLDYYDYSLSSDTSNIQLEDNEKSHTTLEPFSIDDIANHSHTIREYNHSTSVSAHKESFLIDYNTNDIHIAGEYNQSRPASSIMDAISTDGEFSIETNKNKQSGVGVYDCQIRPVPVSAIKESSILKNNTNETNHTSTGEYNDQFRPVSPCPEFSNIF